MRRPARLLLLFLGLLLAVLSTAVEAWQHHQYHHAPPGPMRMATTTMTKTARVARNALLQRTTLKFRFPNVDFMEGMRHIHTPEHIAETHRLGAPFFRILEVREPVLTEERSAVVFLCSTLLTPRMRVLMHSTRPDQSNLIFSVNGRALYMVRLVAEPSASFESHALRLEITFFLKQDFWLFRALRLLLPVFLLINGIEDQYAFHLARSGTAQPHQHGDPRLSAYRNWVLRDAAGWSRHF